MQDIKAWLNSEQDYATGSELYAKYGSNSFFKKILLDGPTPYLENKLEVELKVLASASPAWPKLSPSDYPSKHLFPKTDFYKEVMHVPVPNDSDRDEPNRYSNGKNLDAIYIDEARDIPYVSKSRTNGKSDSHQRIESTFHPVPELPKIEISAESAKDFARYLSLKELNKNTYRQLEHNMTALGMNADRFFLHLTAKNILSLDSKISDIYKLIDHYDEHGSFPVITIADEVIRTPEEQIQLLRQSISRARARIKSGNCKDLAKTEGLIKDKQDEIARIQALESK